MNKSLKEEMGPVLRQIGEKQGIEDFPDKIADETVAITEKEVLEYITRKNHPALSMLAMF